MNDKDTAMTPPPLFDRALAARRLERFQAKWEPVRRPETRQNKNLEHLSDSEKSENALARAARTGTPSHPLADRLAEDLADRLALTLRDFPLSVDLASPTPATLHVLERAPRVGTARRLAPGGTSPDACPGIIADPEALPLAAESVNLVASLMALQSVNDLPGALIQIRRALKPDGLFIAALAGGDTLTELRQSFAIAETALTGGISPRVAPFADVRDLGGLLQRAGFALPVADMERVTIRYPDALALMADLRTAGLSSTLVARTRKPLTRALLGEVLRVYQERFSDPDGRVRATVDVVWLSGWAPHESQQKPLKPGSAKTRLADALGVPETPLKP